MKTGKHAIISLSAGTLMWLFTKSLYAGILCFISGYLIDVDHIIEYVIHYGWKDFSFKRVNYICEQTAKGEGDERFKKVYILFHAVEFAILLWIASLFTKNIYLLAFTIGYSIHIIMDWAGNPSHPYSYLITWRALKDFNADEIFTKRMER